MIGGETGEWDWLARVVAEAGGEVLQREGNDLAKVVRGLEGELLAPHIDAKWLTRFFGEQHNIDQFKRLEQIARVGVPVDVGPGGNL